jgi:PAS domain S-box-containing protein
MTPSDLIKMKGSIKTGTLSPNENRLVGLAELHVINTLVDAGDSNPNQSCSFSRILQKIGNMIEFESAAVFIMDKENQTLQCQASCGLSLKEVKIAEQNMKLTYGNVPLHQQSPLLINLPDSNPSMRNGKTAGTMILAPLRSNGALLGILQLIGLSGSPYGQKEIHLLSLVARQIAMLLENRSLREFRKWKADQYECLLEKATIPLFSISLEGHFLHMNRAMVELLGYPNEAETRRLNFFSNLIHPGSAGNRFRRVFAKSECVNDLEIRIRKKDGSLLSVLACSMALRDIEGKIVGHEGILKDITSAKASAEQLMQCQKMASLGQLTTGIAHDFNNLIGGIMGYASMMLVEMDKKNPLYEDIQTILAAARKSTELTSQLLAYGRQEKYRTQTASLNALVIEILKILKRTFRKDIQIHSTLFPALAAVEVDSTRIQQAVMNVCLNAQDAMPEGGGLFIETENAVLDETHSKNRFCVEPGAYALLRIRDTGGGMDRKTLQRIFEPFFTTKGENKGNGLGLSISLEIVKRHGGGIAVTSKPGKGSTFEIVLPARDGMHVDPEDKEDDRPLPRGNETLLFVDDEEVIRRMGKRMLERFGYNVLMAKDGRDAVQVASDARNKIDLLILDKIMPQMDGTEALQKIKEIRPGIKALLTSGCLVGDSVDRMQMEGFCGFIPKPFLVGQMLDLIRRSLDGPATAFQQ